MKDFAPRTPAAKAAELTTSKGAALVDNRASTVAQRKTQVAIAASPRQVAQRQPAPVQLAAPRPNRTGLPDKLKAGVESLSGHSLDDVKVHYNSAKPAQLQAHAYAQGTDIHLGPGQEKHLPHEAWHVVQQKQGRVRATAQLKGVGVNDNPGLEKEADTMGEEAHGLRPSSRNSAQLSRAGKEVVPISVIARKKINLINKNYIAQLTARGSVKAIFTKNDKKKKEIKNRLRAKEASENNRQKKITNKREELLRNGNMLPAVVEQNDTEMHLSPAEVQPDIIYRLHNLLPADVKNYKEWLSDDASWEKRVEEVKEREEKNKLPKHETLARKLSKAKKYILNAEKLLKDAQDRFPKLPERATNAELRSKSLEFEKENGAKIEEIIEKIMQKLVSIDGLVKEPPVPPKTWSDFMGNRNKLSDYKDGKNKPIPIVFYKSVSDYKPIIVPVNTDSRVVPGTYNFPNGPTVYGRKGKYSLIVKNSNIFHVGSILENSKDSNTRTTQIDINHALKEAGVQMKGLDGDHVRDLGFGGTDTPNNYWPLKSKINRRPFLGWRGSYGLNCIDGTGVPKTKSITALTGKKLIIKASMSASEDNVPEEGVKPEEKSGTIDL